MSSLFSYTLYLQVWLIYNEINQGFGDTEVAGSTFNLGFYLDFASDVAISQAASISSGIGTNIQAYGGVAIGSLVTGELPVLGTALVAGEMSFLGASSFDAELSAAESVFDNIESGFEGIGDAELLFMFGD